MDWYTSSRKSAQEHFPQDWDLFLGFLAVTSVNSTVKSNMTLALKAHAQYTQGKPFKGFLKSVIVNLENVIQGNTLNGPKIGAFYEALRGDKNAVVVDRWMARAYGFKSVTPGNYDKIERSIRLEAAANSMKPSDFQAWKWANIRGAGEDFGALLNARRAQGRLF